MVLFQEQVSTGGIVGINAGIIKNAEVDITVNNTSGGYSGGITGYNYKGLGEIDGIVGKIKVINSTVVIQGA